MVARPDPADPARYIGVDGDDLSNAVALFRDGVRVRPTIPQILQRGDEMEMARDVICVWRYPIGDVYIDGATRVRVGSLDVLFGKLFARVRGLFSVENQNVVAGVEGTEFAFEVATDGTTQITVLDGTVLSSSKNLPWKPLRVTRGQAFTVTDVRSANADRRGGAGHACAAANVVPARGQRGRRACAARASGATATTTATATATSTAAASATAAATPATLCAAAPAAAPASASAHHPAALSARGAVGLLL